MSGEQQQQQTTEQTKAEETPKWVEELKASFGEVGKGIGTLVDLAKASQAARQAPPQQTEEEPEDGSDLLDEGQLELLPRRAFAERLMASFEQSLDGKLQPLLAQMQRQGQDILTQHYMSEAEKFAAKTKDFAEWSEEMQAIAKDNANLPISRIYAIARSENVKKAKEMDEKYADKTQETQKPPVRKAPLSLTTQSNSGEVKQTRMNAEDAGKSAWEETVAKFGNPFSSQ